MIYSFSFESKDKHNRQTDRQTQSYAHLFDSIVIAGSAYILKLMIKGNGEQEKFNCKGKTARPLVDIEILIG